MRLRQQQKMTTAQTLNSGVWVYLFIFLRCRERGRASSRASAKQVRVSASMAVIPVKNWIKMGQNHSAKPVFFPAALKKTCAAGLPRGDAKVSSTLPAQNPRAILSITPTTHV